MPNVLSLPAANAPAPPRITTAITLPKAELIVKVAHEYLTKHLKDKTAIEIFSMAGVDFMELREQSFGHAQGSGATQVTDEQAIEYILECIAPCLLRSYAMTKWVRGARSQLVIAAIERLHLRQTVDAKVVDKHLVLTPSRLVAAWPDLSAAVLDHSWQLLDHSPALFTRIWASSCASLCLPAALSGEPVVIRSLYAAALSRYRETNPGKGDPKLEWKNLQLRILKANLVSPILNDTRRQESFPSFYEKSASGVGKCLTLEVIKFINDLSMDLTPAESAEIKLEHKAPLTQTSLF